MTWSSRPSHGEAIPTTGCGSSSSTWRDFFKISRVRRPIRRCRGVPEPRKHSLRRQPRSGRERPPPNHTHCWRTRNPSTGFRGTYKTDLPGGEWGGPRATRTWPTRSTRTSRVTSPVMGSVLASRTGLPRYPRRRDRWRKRRERFWRHRDCARNRPPRTSAVLVLRTHILRGHPRGHGLQRRERSRRREPQSLRLAAKSTRCCYRSGQRGPAPFEVLTVLTTFYGRTNSDASGFSRIL